MLLSSRLITRQARLLRLSARHFNTKATLATPHSAAIAVAAFVTAGAAACTFPSTKCSAPLGAEAVMLAPKTEEATGILFPRLCNGMTLAGCGVRVKWGFVKVNLVSFRCH